MKVKPCKCGGVARIIIRDEQNIIIACTDCDKRIKCTKPGGFILQYNDGEADIITLPESVITSIEEGIKIWNSTQK